ncbi:MAG: hypothetical protein VX438_04390 [Planctomycetota bacterium]|nr:hypothetical protein [Planctomycetota bacterium]
MFTCSRFSGWFLLFFLGSTIGLSGCNDQEKQSLRHQLTQQKRRADAYREDAAQKQKAAYAADDRRKNAVMESDKLRAEIQRLKAQIDEINGIKKLQALGAVIKRNDRGNVVSFDMLNVESFTNDQLKPLENFKSVQEVYLTGPSINPATFDILSKLPNLRLLETSVSGTNSECLKKLSGLKQLAYLQLKRTSVNDATMAILATFPNLQQIRVGQTKVGDVGLAHLQNLKTLVALDLTDCNKVSDTGLGHLENLPKLKMLKVWGKGITNKGLESIGKISNLEVLGMNDTRIDDEGMFAVNGLTKLKEVSFARTAVSDFGIMQLTGATNMKKMVLRDTNITDEALKYIGKMNELEILDLSECSSPGPTDVGMEQLVGLPKLKDINLWSTKVSDGTVAAVAKMQKVVRLNLDATQITDNCMANLQQMKQLTWLHIGSTKISDKEISNLYQLDKLKYINLSFTEASFSEAVDDIYDRLKKSTADSCEIIGL